MYYSLTTFICVVNCQHTTVPSVVCCCVLLGVIIIVGVRFAIIRFIYALCTVLLVWGLQFWNSSSAVCGNLALLPVCCQKVWMEIAAGPIFKPQNSFILQHHGFFSNAASKLSKMDPTCTDEETDGGTSLCTPKEPHSRTSRYAQQYAYK